MTLEPDPVERIRLIRKHITAHRRAVERGKLEEAEQAALDAAEHTRRLLAWLDAGGELQSEWDRFA